MKKLLLTAAMAATMLTSANAASISGSTDFKVTVPEILVLYHWDIAHLTLTTSGADPANDSDPDFENSDATERDLSKSLGATGDYIFTGPAVDTTTNATSPLGSSINVVLENAWAVRSISSDDVELAVTIQEANLELDGDASKGSKAVVSDAKLKSGTAAAAAALDLAPQWAVTQGNIEFTLDLSGVTKSGDHKTAATAAESTDTFLLTLTGN